MNSLSAGDATNAITPVAAATLAERDRNRLLRRADWRYLLPHASPARALCIADTELRASCAVVAGSVDDTPRPGVTYDLVVAEDPDDATLRLLAGMLRADGACYVEWGQTWLNGMQRIRHRMECAGFHSLRCYHPWPSVTRCRAWVPTDPPAATYYWHASARSTRVRRDRLRDVVGATLARMGVHGRIGVVASGGGGGTGIDSYLIRAARDHGACTAMDDVPSTSGDLLLLTPGERAVGKVVALAFEPDGAPALAVKTARVPEGADGLTREADMLDVVHTLHPNGLAGAPRVLCRTEVCGEPVLGESALPGRPLAALLTRRRYAQIAEQVTAWLSALAEPAAASRAESPWARVIEPALERFTVEFASVVGETQLRRTREMLQTIGPLPVVCEQRDFSPWNVFQGSHGIVVLDWESGEPRGLPAMDLLYFFTHAAYYLEGAWTSGRFEAAYRAAWSRETRIGAVNHTCMQRYLEQLGVSPDVLPPLRLLAWVLHSHSDYIHLRADVGGTPSADVLRRSTFLRLYDTELEAAG